MSARNTDWNNATAGRPLSLDDIKRAVRDLRRGWPWMVLDIDATIDVRTIKKAYAATIRANPPEGDPAAFQRVREAYEAAIESVRPRVRVHTDSSNRNLINIEWDMDYDMDLDAWEVLTGTKR